MMPRIKKPNLKSFQLNEKIFLSIFFVPLLITVFSCSILCGVMVNNKWGRADLSDADFNSLRGNSENSSSDMITALAVNTDNEKISIYLEVADSDDELTYGLMNRSSLEQDHGMIFAFPDEDYRTFWMKNTYIPLDIAFLDKNKQIIDIHANTTPLNTENTYSSSKPAMYAVETNAFWFEENGIEEGALIEFSV